MVGDGCSLVFFFQAEDGIRDLTVTGVQTCALPISSSLRSTAGTGSGSGQSSVAKSGAAGTAAGSGQSSVAKTGAAGTAAGSGQSSVAKTGAAGTAAGSGQSSGAQSGGAGPGHRCPPADAATAAA